jgi:hypothetical protein
LALRNRRRKGTIEIQASVEETLHTNLVIGQLVILSEAKDLCNLSAPINARKNRRTKRVRLPKSMAPWPIPPLKILATRKGKQIFSTPPAS